MAARRRSRQTGTLCDSTRSQHPNIQLNLPFFLRDPPHPSCVCAPPARSIKLERKIGAGASGQVWAGKYAGLDVAVKVVTLMGSGAALAETVNEIKREVRETGWLAGWLAGWLGCCWVAGWLVAAADVCCLDTGPFSHRPPATAAVAAAAMTIATRCDSQQCATAAQATCTTTANGPLTPCPVTPLPLPLPPPPPTTPARPPRTPFKLDGTGAAAVGHLPPPAGRDLPRHRGQPPDGRGVPGGGAGEPEPGGVAHAQGAFLMQSGSRDEPDHTAHTRVVGSGSR
jgi:hypothetical protein